VADEHPIVGTHGKAVKRRHPRLELAAIDSGETNADSPDEAGMARIRALADEQGRPDRSR
jgi:hypothetical protein